MTAGRSDLVGWTPVRARPQGDELTVEWRWLDDAPFREPFFTETVQRALERPFSLLFPRLTTIDELAALEPGLEPDGFILHMSRCGSTLVSQMLAAVPEYLVLSEPLLVNDVLRAPAPDRERIRRLRLAVAALGRPRTGSERGYVIKLDPWATHDLPLIRRAFPETPWLFLSRDPLEVLVSHRRQPGYQMLPSVVSPALFGLDFMSAVSMPFEEYGARVLGATCRDALAYRDERTLFSTTASYRARCTTGCSSSSCSRRPRTQRHSCRRRAGATRRFRRGRLRPTRRRRPTRRARRCARRSTAGRDPPTICWAFSSGSGRCRRAR